MNIADRPENRPIIRALVAKLWKFAYDRKDTCINPYIMVSLAEFDRASYSDKDDKGTFRLSQNHATSRTRDQIPCPTLYLRTYIRTSRFM